MAADPTQDPGAAGADPTQGAPGAPGAPGADPSQGQQPPETITITVNGDGTYSVDDGDGGQPVQCKSLGDVMKAVHDALSGDGDSDADDKAAWGAEAAKRGPDGMPAQGGSGGPSMTMP